MSETPSIGVRGQRIRRVEFEIRLVEFADGTRVGTAVADVGGQLDAERAELVSSLQSYAETLEQSGHAGLEQRLREEQDAAAASMAASPGDTTSQCALQNVEQVQGWYRVLKPEGFERLLHRVRVMGH